MTFRASLQQLREIAAGTELETVAGAECEILDTGDTALILEIDPNSIERSWLIARSFLNKTNRWPVVTTTGSDEDICNPEGFAEILFDRFCFLETPGKLDQDPLAIIERSKSVDVDAFLSRLAAEEAERAEDWLTEWMLEQAFSITGRMPRNGELDESLIYKKDRVDRYILQYQVENGLFKPVEECGCDWMSVDNAYLVFLPITESWESLAYLYWGPICPSLIGAEFYIALGSRWKSRFGAELVCHYGPVLECNVSQPPKDPYDAWDLTREHALVNREEIDQTLMHLHEYANFYVLGCDRWRLCF